MTGQPVDGSHSSAGSFVALAGFPPSRYVTTADLDRDMA
jgi:hypothetical protein